MTNKRRNDLELFIEKKKELILLKNNYIISEKTRKEKKEKIDKETEIKNEKIKERIIFEENKFKLLDPKEAIKTTESFIEKREKRKEKLFNELSKENNSKTKEKLSNLFYMNSLNGVMTSTDFWKVLKLPNTGKTSFGKKVFHYVSNLSPDNSKNDIKLTEIKFIFFCALFLLDKEQLKQDLLIDNTTIDNNDIYLIRRDFIFNLFASKDNIIISKNDFRNFISSLFEIIINDPDGYFAENQNKSYNHHT